MYKVADSTCSLFYFFFEFFHFNITNNIQTSTIYSFNHPHILIPNTYTDKLLKEKSKETIFLRRDDNAPLKTKIIKALVLLF